MGSRLSRIARYRHGASSMGGALALLLSLAAAAGAQTPESEAPPERDEAAAPAGTGTENGAESAEAPEAPDAPEAAPVEPDQSGFPKTLTPQQRLPENLRGWLRERNRRHPALAERPPPPAPAGLAPMEDEEGEDREQAVEVYRSRLRSFEQDGVTVLSNRHPAPTPPAPPPPAEPVAAIPVAAPAPAPPEEEPEPEAPRLSETHSLRPKHEARNAARERDLGWLAFAVPAAGASLGLIWLRRRRQLRH